MPDGAVAANSTKTVRGRPFEKGQSGNPNGRPKGSEEVRELAREFTQDAVKRLGFWMKSRNAKASVSACNALLDRGWGKPIQEVDVKARVTFADAFEKILADLAARKK